MSRYCLDTRSFVWTFALVALGACYRVAAPVFEFPVNTAPLMALSFGGAMLLGWRFWWVPVAALVASDLALGWLLPGSGIGGYTLMSGLLYAGSAWLGGFIGSKRTSWSAMWSGTLGCGVLFYLAANTYSWLALPDYAKTLSGWWQSQTTGVPHFSPPSWFFLRNSLIADTVWCGIAALVHLAVRRPLPAVESRGAAAS